MAGEHAQVGNVTYRALFPVYRGKKKLFPLFNCKGNHTGNFRIFFFAPDMQVSRFGKIVT